MPQALVLERARDLALRDIDLDATLREGCVRIRTEVVGVCGSDVHYYTHGRIGPFVVEAPMVLGHEAAGVVTEVGPGVTGLAVGDRVCVEPGVPDWTSRAARIGLYNLDPSLTFWATPPVHGCLTPEVVHPAVLCHRLPETVSAAQGAMVEPLAVAVQAARKAGIAPGDRALVLGAGPIGLLMALTALASGCAEVMVFDPADAKLHLAGAFPGVVPLHARDGALAERVGEATGGWGVDLVFECSGAPKAFEGVGSLIRPGGTLVCVGMPVDPVAVDIVELQVREVTVVTVFRYANVYDRAIALLAGGRIDVAPLITSTYGFGESVAAFERAAEARPGDVKIQIDMAR